MLAQFMTTWSDCVIEILRRTGTTNVSVGFLDNWESMGDFYGTCLEYTSSNAAYQQQFSRLSLFKVSIPDGPRLTYSKTRFRVEWKDDRILLLQPERDPKQHGTMFRTDWQVECTDISGFNEPDEAGSIPSIDFPAVNPIEGESHFVADGLVKAFTLSFELSYGTSQVVLNGQQLLRNFDYMEDGNVIRLRAKPPRGAKIDVTGIVGES